MSTTKIMLQFCNYGEWFTFQQMSRHGFLLFTLSTLACVTLVSHTQICFKCLKLSMTNINMLSSINAYGMIKPVSWQLLLTIFVISSLSKK